MTQKNLFQGTPVDTQRITKEIRLEKTLSGYVAYVALSGKETVDIHRPTLASLMDEVKLAVLRYGIR